MAYRQDPDLEFMSSIASADLESLVLTLTQDKDGSRRYTETLTVSDEYKLHAPDHQKYWQLIASELQHFGANTFATLARGGEGVLYREVLTDVCDKLKVNYNKESAIEQIEKGLLDKVLSDALHSMTEEELRELAKSMGVASVGALTKDALIAACIAAFRMGGFSSFKWTMVILNRVLKWLIGRGLPFAAGPIIAQGLKFLTGPAGWALTGVWTAFDIANPAYRVTVPAVIQVAALRQRLREPDAGA
jgi:uncharacterized protein YaaW (UPF0174 family)